MSNLQNVVLKQKFEAKKVKLTFEAFVNEVLVFFEDISGVKIKDPGKIDLKYLLFIIEGYMDELNEKLPKQQHFYSKRTEYKSIRTFMLQDLIYVFNIPSITDDDDDLDLGDTLSQYSPYIQKKFLPKIDLSEGALDCLLIFVTKLVVSYLNFLSAGAAEQYETYLITHQLDLYARKIGRFEEQKQIHEKMVKSLKSIQKKFKVKINIEEFVENTCLLFSVTCSDIYDNIKQYGVSSNDTKSNNQINYEIALHAIDLICYRDLCDESIKFSAEKLLKFKNNGQKVRDLKLLISPNLIKEVLKVYCNVSEDVKDNLVFTKGSIIVVSSVIHYLLNEIYKAISKLDTITEDDLFDIIETDNDLKLIPAVYSLIFSRDWVNELIKSLHGVDEDEKDNHNDVNNTATNTTTTTTVSNNNNNFTSVDNLIDQLGDGLL